MSTSSLRKRGKDRPIEINVPVHSSLHATSGLCEEHTYCETVEVNDTGELLGFMRVYARGAFVAVSRVIVHNESRNGNADFAPLPLPSETQKKASNPTRFISVTITVARVCGMR